MFEIFFKVFGLEEVCVKFVEEGELCSLMFLICSVLFNLILWEKVSCWLINIFFFVINLFYVVFRFGLVSVLSIRVFLFV